MDQRVIFVKISVVQMPLELNFEAKKICPHNEAVLYFFKVLTSEYVYSIRFTTKLKIVQVLI